MASSLLSLPSSLLLLSSSSSSSSSSAVCFATSAVCRKLPVLKSNGYALRYLKGSRWCSFNGLGSRRPYDSASLADSITCANSVLRGEELPSSVDARDIRSADEVYEGKRDGGSGEVLADISEEPDASSDNKMARFCDKLIEVFMVDKPTTSDWRKLLAFSKQWPEIRSHFYSHCQARGEAESDPDMQLKLFRLGRKLKEVDDDMQNHHDLLTEVRKAPSDISAVVAKRRKDFTVEFFEHLHIVASSYFDNPEEQTDLLELGDDCWEAVQAFDNASEATGDLNAAELNFQDLLNSPSLGEADKKIDSLAEKNQLDSELMLLLTKAWASGKETSLVKDEAKDIMYHMYLETIGNLQRRLPKEVRILKYILNIEDPERKLSVLKDAFTPGPEIEGEHVDHLYTTPIELYTLVRRIIDAYGINNQSTGIPGVRKLMNPKTIDKLEKLKFLIEKNFL